MSIPSIMLLHTALDALNHALKECEKSGTYVNLRVTAPDAKLYTVDASKLEIKCIKSITQGDT